MQTRLVELRTGSAEVVLDVTDRCAAFLRDIDAGSGLLHVFVPHATAGVAVLETGAGSDEDLLAALQDLLPPGAPWRHRHGSPGHGRDHVLPALIAPFAVLPVIDGAPALGRWQSVCLVDTNVDNAVRSLRLSFLTA